MSHFRNPLLRILTHNVFWFQGVPFDTDQPGPVNQTVWDECLSVYFRLKSTILCFQEVQNEAVARSLAAALGLSHYYTAGRELKQYGGCILAGAGKLIASSNSAGSLFQRMWQILAYETSTGKVITIANVHLPSDRQIEPAEAAQKRVDELRQVLALAPDILCGDLNERPHGRVTMELEAAGYRDCAEFTHNEDRSTSIGARRTDYIWVRSCLAGRVCGYGLVPFHSFLSKAPGKTFISDHLPLWIDVRV
ncbi:MAG: endonuclease/exonuclease/phosphatase family protein [Kiritimatiellae bacterium]|nr:endonuclease/exonuclease/phosphatase family protein [Kiritimatiellia bacterium]